MTKKGFHATISPNLRLKLKKLIDFDFGFCFSFGLVSVLICDL